MSNRPKHYRKRNYLLVVEKFLEKVSNGLSYKDAAKIAGSSHDAIEHWRRQDPLFNERCFEATAKFKEKHLENIAEHGKKNWTASAWLLERTFPEEYAQRSVVSLEGNITKEMTEELNAGRERARKFRSTRIDAPTDQGSIPLLQ